MERDQGALLRQTDTTKQATAPIRASRNGLFVRIAQTANPAAHNHHAAGWRERSRRAAARVTRPPAYDANGRVRHRRGLRRRPRPARPGGACFRSHRHHGGKRSWRGRSDACSLSRVHRHRCHPDARSPAVLVLVVVLLGAEVVVATPGLGCVLGVVVAAGLDPAFGPPVVVVVDRRRRCGGRHRRRRRLNRRHLSRRVTDLGIGRGRLGWWVGGIVRFVGLEPPAFHVIDRARHRLFGRAVVCVDPRSRRPVPVRPIVVVPGSDALTAVLHPVGRIVVNGAQESRVVVGDVVLPHGRRQCVRVVGRRRPRGRTWRWTTSRTHSRSRRQRPRRRRCPPNRLTRSPS